MLPIILKIEFHLFTILFIVNSREKLCLQFQSAVMLKFQFLSFFSLSIETHSDLRQFDE